MKHISRPKFDKVATDTAYSPLSWQCEKRFLTLSL